MPDFLIGGFTDHFPAQSNVGYIYMGGTSQDVKRQQSGIVTLYTLGFFVHLHFFALMKFTMCLRHLEASHIMYVIADTKAQQTIRF